MAEESDAQSRHSVDRRSFTDNEPVADTSRVERGVRVVPTSASVATSTAVLPTSCGSSPVMDTGRAPIYSVASSATQTMQVSTQPLQFFPVSSTLPGIPPSSAPQAADAALQSLPADQQVTISEAGQDDLPPPTVNSVLRRAWELLQLYVPDQCLPASQHMTVAPVLGFPQLSPVISSRPVARQHALAHDIVLRQVSTVGASQETGPLSIEPLRRSLALLTPSDSLMEYYRIRYSGVHEIPMPRAPYQVPLATFRDMQRRASYVSDVSNFLALLSAAQSRLLSRGVLTDVQQEHLLELAAAFALVTRDLSALSSTMEVDLHRCRQRAALEASSVDPAVRPSLLELPLVTDNLFQRQAARNILARPRLRPYPRQRLAATPQRRTSATITSQGQASAPVQIPAPPQARGSRSAPRPFRRGRRGRRQ